MARYSIKRVEFNGELVRSLSFPHNYGLDSNKGALNAEGRKMVTNIIKSWESDYKENGDEIGTITARYYFQEFTLDLGVEYSNEKGHGVCFDCSNMGKNFYELVLKIYVPFKDINYTDVHIYRYNLKYGEFEYIESEIL